MRREMSDTVRAALTEDVMTLLATFGGRVAVSFLLREARCTFGSSSGVSAHRWRGLGCLSDFEDTLRDLGFDVVRDVNERGQRCTVVTVETPAEAAAREAAVQHARAEAKDAYEETMVETGSRAAAVRASEARFEEAYRQARRAA